MKKRIITALIAVAMIFSAAITSSAANQTIGYESSYDAGTDIVTVTVYINNAVGVQAADLCLGYDGTMYEFQESVFYDIGGGIAEGGKSIVYEDLITACVIYTNDCTAEDTDANGRLTIASYKFKPLTEDYDIDYFYLWADSFVIAEVDLYKDINTQGNAILQEDKSGGVTFTTNPDEQDAGANAGETTTKKATEGVKGNLKSKWYVYVIGAVLAIGAIAGIAMVVVKGNHEEENQNDESEEKSDDSKENSDED